MARFTKVDPDEYLGQILSDRFFIARRIGRGSFASVYLAHQPDGPPTAVKMLHTDESLAHLRFIREIKVMQAIPSSSHLVSYVAHGALPTGGAYLAMELVTGKTLREKMSSDLLSPEDACTVIYQIATALQPLHRFGIVHRDLKPSNVLMTKEGTVKLFDFGLVLDSEGFLRLFEEEDILEGRAFSEDVEEGIIVGTPEYMAVEQFQDAARNDPFERKTSAASDVFSLGVIFYRLVTGEFPFPMTFKGDRPQREDYMRYFRQRLKMSIDDVPRPARVDDALWSIISRCIGAPVEQRQPDGRAFADEIINYIMTGAGTDSIAGPSTDMLPVAAVRRLVDEVDGEEENLTEELSIQTVWSDLGDEDWLEDVPEAPWMSNEGEDELTTKETVLDPEMMKLCEDIDTQEIVPSEELVNACREAAAEVGIELENNPRKDSGKTVEDKLPSHEIIIDDEESLIVDDTPLLPMNNPLKRRS